MRVQENVPLSELTTMRLGGPARFLLEIEEKSDVPAAYNFAKEKNLSTFVLGAGANTIARDEGFNGVIIKNIMAGIELINTTGDASGRDPTELAGAEGSERMPWEGQDAAGPVANASRQDPLHIKAHGGTEWDAVVAFACERGLTGIEALSKIPGLAGAAPVQNIGAYGQDVSGAFLEAEVYDTKDETFKILKKSDFGFAYRKSILNTTEKNRYFVISITLGLKQGEMPRPFYNSIEKYLETHPATSFPPAKIREIVSEIRKNKLPDPLEKASAGSFFKNIYLTEAEAKIAEEKGCPVYKGHDGLKINSGWLIEQAGLKGQLLHGIRVSNTAALVLINESATSYNDLAKARTEIKQAIKEKFGYTLEQEPVELPMI